MVENVTHDENKSVPVSILMLPLPLDMHQPCGPVVHKTQDMCRCASIVSVGIIVHV